jgi:hypothetical protein
MSQCSLEAVGVQTCLRSPTVCVADRSISFPILSPRRQRKCRGPRLILREVHSIPNRMKLTYQFPVSLSLFIQALWVVVEDKTRLKVETGSPPPPAFTVWAEPKECARYLILDPRAFGRDDEHIQQIPTYQTKTLFTASLFRRHRNTTVKPGHKDISVKIRGSTTDNKTSHCWF